MELKDELKKLERELSTLVARFLKIYDAVVDEPEVEGPAQAPKALADEDAHVLGPGFTTDYLTAYT